MEQKIEGGGASPVFRPHLAGCVAKDIRMARWIEECYVGALSSMAAYTYRSLMTEQSDPALSRQFDGMSVEKAEHFRLLGELILALGGEPGLRAQIRVGWCDRRGRDAGDRATLLREAMREERYAVDRMQTLMGRTEDRVVRSLLSYLVSDGERCLSVLEGAAG